MDLSGGMDPAVVRGVAPPIPAEDEQGRPRVRGAGPLRFECHEPFLPERALLERAAKTSGSRSACANEMASCLAEAANTPAQRCRFQTCASSGHHF